MKILMLVEVEQTDWLDALPVNAAMSTLGDIVESEREILGWQRKVLWMREVPVMAEGMTAVPPILPGGGTAWAKYPIPWPKDR